MKNTFFTSDTHFNHYNIIKYCNRPFNSIQEMNQEIINKWNSVVKNIDTVYHLGDFAFGSFEDASRILKKLNGIKILIKGNHDRSIKRMLELGFNEVYSEYEWNEWLLKHIPVDVQKKQLCGHIHTAWKKKGHTINVGVDMWNFTPRTIDELIGG